MVRKKILPKKYKSKRTYVKNFSFAATHRRGRSGESVFPKLIKFVKKTFLRVLALGILVCVFLLLFRAYNYAKTYLYDDDRLFIDNIEVVGCNNVTETEIKNLIPFKVGDNMLKICLLDTKRQLQKQKPELKKISLTRKWKEKKIVISLEERTPEVFILKGENKIGLDFDNKPFSLRGKMFEMKVPVLVYSNDTEKESLLSFFKQFKKYMGEFVPNIKEIKYGEVEDVILNMGDKTVCWGQAQYKKMEEKADKLKTVFEDLSNKNISAKHIDLSLIDNNKGRIIVKTAVCDYGETTQQKV